MVRGADDKNGRTEMSGIARRGRKAKKQRALAGLVLLTVLVAIVFIMTFACVWMVLRMQEKTEPAFGEDGQAAADGQQGGTELVDIDENGNVVDADGNVIGALSNYVAYSQEELERQVTDAKKQAEADVLGSIRAGLSDGDSLLQTLRPLYPDELIVYSGGKYNFVPINRSLKLHEWDEACLNILDTGEYQYVRNGEIISHKGIDVSKHQGEIDWNMVAADGVEFAFIRVGYRGYGTGKMVEDEYFEDNIKGAAAAGIKVGVYYYSQAINEEEVLEEANFVLEKIAPYKIDCPVVFDVEKVSGDEARMNDISVEERTALTQRFCQIIENAGYRPMVYHNTEMGAMLLNLELLEGYDKWFAAYSDVFYYPYDYKIWQYSQSGRVQGIKGDVDLNISFAPLWQ